MGPHTPIGKNRIAGLTLLLLGSFSTAYSQSSLVCSSTAAPPLVRAEGLSERLGDIVLNCTGGNPGAVISGNLTVFLSVNDTNRLSANQVVDAGLTVDTGAGPVAANVAGILAAPNSVSFNGLRFALSPAGSVTLVVSNLRGSANQLNLTQLPPPILAFLSLNFGMAVTITNPQISVAIPQRGLLATFSQEGVRCNGSPLPSTMDLPGLFAAGTRFFSTRVTEGFANAFEKTSPSVDTGVRIRISYSGYPPGARLFVPDAIAGSSAVEPTAAGDLGTLASGGKYQPGSPGSLLLVRVTDADATGAGGTLAYTPGPPGPPPVQFSSASEVRLSGGAGAATFEVVDSNPGLVESAQIPTFLGLTPITNGESILTNQSVSLAPVSNVGTASVSAPIPRFIAVDPISDCPALGDCNASYFPQLIFDGPDLTFTAAAGSTHTGAYMRVHNNGGGLLNWSASTNLKNGSGWLTIDPRSGPDNATLRAEVYPEKLAPGKYEATITVDAGPMAGSRSRPVSLTVTPATQPQTQPPPDKQPAPSVVVSSVVNAASFQPGSVVPGSLATVLGSNLSGKSVQVTFNQLSADLLFVGEKQINLLVPSLPPGPATLVVTVDGQASAPVSVPLAATGPAVFNPGILNEDSVPNGPGSPAAAGSVVQIFGTGIPVLGAGVTVRIADRDNLVPLFAGPAPGIAGVQQVNVAIPADLSATNADLSVCSPGQPPVCSPAVKLLVQ